MISESSRGEAGVGWESSRPAWASEGVVPITNQARTWKAPAIGSVKINFDGAIVNDGRAAVGIVVRDFRGCVLASCIEQFRYFYDVDHVEALDAIRASSMAKDLGFSLVVFEDDSLSVINSINAVACR
ncbi:hypothetical protein LOK49_LG15G00095 [Camellia lanceoleosa]|uniref:Uncharacterized protein n=1 Tax=Camellia lanceoleosa TaxID=1840588 RepID=A0ACC0F2Q3_9ERIC|nr:hypothetical protein LOK49_LG15G00095 [Camellia lanceoleosa]